jgi:hypothetical protein
MNSIKRNNNPTVKKISEPAVADAWDSDEWNYVPLVSLVATSKREESESKESEIEFSTPVITGVESSKAADIAESKPAASSSRQAASTSVGASQRRGRLIIRAVPAKEQGLPSKAVKAKTPIAVAQPTKADQGHRNKSPYSNR